MSGRKRTGNLPALWEAAPLLPSQKEHLLGCLDLCLLKPSSTMRLLVLTGRRTIAACYNSFSGATPGRFSDGVFQLLILMLSWGRGPIQKGLCIVSHNYLGNYSLRKYGQLYLANAVFISI